MIASLTVGMFVLVAHFQDYDIQGNVKNESYHFLAEYDSQEGCENEVAGDKFRSHANSLVWNRDDIDAITFYCMDKGQPVEKLDQRVNKEVVQSESSIVENL